MILMLITKINLQYQNKFFHGIKIFLNKRCTQNQFGK